MEAIVRVPRLLIVLALLVAGCSGGDAPADTADETGEAGEATERIAEAFVPAADQFGVEQFKIVYALEGQESGTRTMWVEEYGARVGVEDALTVYGQPRNQHYYWDGERGYMKELPDGEVSSSGLRTRASEPTSFATTPAASLEQVGYTRLGEKTIVGHTCEHWKNDQLNYEGCRWQNIELEFMNGAGTEQIIQQTVATEYVEGEGIPERIKALAQ